MMGDPSVSPFPLWLPISPPEDVWTLELKGAPWLGPQGLPRSGRGSRAPDKGSRPLIYPEQLSLGLF